MKQSSVFLKKARENIEVAEIILREGYPEIAASRTYYAMFYLAEALLYSKGFSFSSHTAVIAAFGREFAKTGQLNPEHHRHLIDAFEARQLGDYVTEEAVISTGKAKEMITQAREFLTETGEIPEPLSAY